MADAWDLGSHEPVLVRVRVSPPAPGTPGGEGAPPRGFFVDLSQGAWGRRHGGAHVNVTVERTAPDTAVISVEVEPERVSRAVGEAYRRLAQRYAIPGFRRGKVPRPVLESFLGRDTIYREALEQLVDETFDEAVESQDLRVVGSAQLEETAELRDGEPLRYRATVKVKPPVTVPDPRQLTVDVDKPAVTEEDVEHFLQDLQRVHGKLVKAEEVGPHSLVRAEVETEVEGQLLEEKRETLLDMEQGDPLVEDLPAALAGSPAGEVRQVVWTVPQDHPLHGGKEAVTRRPPAGSSGRSPGSQIRRPGCGRASGQGTGEP
jgi:trigger factor